MKKLLIILIALVTILSGCRYKEGPLISFRSVEKRLTGKWQIVGLTSNGVDSLQYYNDTCGCKVVIYKATPDAHSYSIIFKEGKSFFGGEFTLSNNKKIMNVQFSDITPTIIGPIGKGKSDWRILRLKEGEFKISTDFNGRNYIISFKW
jgi:hypothetical protein